MSYFFLKHIFGWENYSGKWFSAITSKDILIQVFFFILQGSSPLLSPGDIRLLVKVRFSGTWYSVAPKNASLVGNYNYGQRNGNHHSEGKCEFFSLPHLICQEMYQFSFKRGLEAYEDMQGVHASVEHLKEL